MDAVLTSPPYLNGTNYFRNTKVELWFLRCLRTAEDLADFRFRTVTSGINDVTNAKLTGDVPSQARALISRLEESAYDVRIPRMVGSYFVGMKAVFLALKKHLVDQGTIMLDIGDSAYGNVHVPTDRLLGAILADLGFSLRREVVLRKRMSRGGFALRQVLLVFDPPGPHCNRCMTARDRPSASLGKGMERFKRSFLTSKKISPSATGGIPLHSLCSYQGKMKPSLAHHLVKTFIPDGGRMLDPFAGVGTIPFEAALEGVHSWSFEISPAAYHIAKAKIGLPEVTECARVRMNWRHLLKRGRWRIRSWRRPEDSIQRSAAGCISRPRHLRKFCSARRFFLLRPPRSSSESLVFASLLHILHGNRPYALSRRSHPITPFAPTGPAEYRPLMPRLREKVAAVWMLHAADISGRAGSLFKTQRHGGRVKSTTLTPSSPRRRFSTAHGFTWQTGCGFGSAAGKRTIFEYSLWPSWTNGKKRGFEIL